MNVHIFCYFSIYWSDTSLLLFCQPRVEVTSCFVYKVMALTFYDRINTLLINIFELAQVVARRITKPQRNNYFGSNLTGPLTCIRHIYKNICNNNINYCQYVNNI